MSMTQSNHQNIEPLDQMIRQEISTINALNDGHLRQILSYAKGFLDKVFPLAQGSHQDVCSYVVYYQHLLMFKKDGSQCGLADPSQFVALCGSREKPQAILLRDQGRHVELIFSKSSLQGALDQAGIEDIQLEIAREQPEQNQRWFSMIHGQLRSNIRRPCIGSCYTAKDGSDYFL